MEKASTNTIFKDVCILENLMMLADDEFVAT